MEPRTQKVSSRCLDCRSKVTVPGLGSQGAAGTSCAAQYVHQSPVPAAVELRIYREPPSIAGVWARVASIDRSDTRRFTIEAVNRCDIITPYLSKGPSTPPFLALGRRHPFGKSFLSHFFFFFPFLRNFPQEPGVPTQIVVLPSKFKIWKFCVLSLV